MRNNLSITALSFFVLCALGCSVAPYAQVDRQEASTEQVEAYGVLTKKWRHGSPQCAKQDSPSFDVLSVSANTHILRQDKCKTFEAPFIYLLEGESRSLLLDTGAIEDPSTSSLFNAVKLLLNVKNDVFLKPLLIAHTHSHLDHINGDTQFSESENVTIIEPSLSSVVEHFALSDWPNGYSYIELGNRKLVVIPTPGHHKDAIAIYDPKTQFLFTGDTLYPGQIYVRDWDQYRDSIIRLSDFAQNHTVKAVLGAHIEMTSTPGVMYAIGTTYQPEEDMLPLSPQDVHMLADQLKAQQDSKELKFARFIVTPMSFIQKTLSKIISVFF